MSVQRARQSTSILKKRTANLPLRWVLEILKSIHFIRRIDNKSDIQCAEWLSRTTAIWWQIYVIFFLAYLVGEIHRIWWSHMMLRHAIIKVHWSTTVRAIIGEELTFVHDTVNTKTKRKMEEKLAPKIFYLRKKPSYLDRLMRLLWKMFSHKTDLLFY